MKYYGLVTVGLFLTLADCKRERPPFAFNSETISEEKLRGSEPGRAGWYLEFDKDGKYSADFGSDHIFWHDTGRYLIRGEKIILIAIGCYKDSERSDHLDCAKSLGNATCALVQDADSLTYTYALRCHSDKNKTLLNESSPNSDLLVTFAQTQVPAGESRIYQDRPIVTMGLAKGKVVRDTTIHSSPSKADEVKFQPGTFAEDLTPRSVVPAETKLTIIARTKTKIKSGEREGYWYLVVVGANERVWMFSEDVEILK